MNIPSAEHCSGCGYPLGLEPIGKADDLTCPSCEEPLEVFRGGAGRLWDCGLCGGQFVQHVLLRELIRRRELCGAAVPRHPRRHNPLSQPVAYIPCPACQELMHRRNFGGSSGIIVDECRLHGVWFDPGELPAVLAFVENGGLARARHRELEMLARRPTPQSTEIAKRRTPVLWADHQGSVLADIAEAAVVLLDATIEALFRR